MLLAKCLNAIPGIKAQVAEVTPLSRVGQHTLEHLDLVRKSLIPKFDDVKTASLAAGALGVARVGPRKRQGLGFPVPASTSPSPTQTAHQ